jgi:hypothetical protein
MVKNIRFCFFHTLFTEDGIGLIAYALLSAMERPTAAPTRTPTKAPIPAGRSRHPTFAPTSAAPFNIDDVPPPTSQPSSQPSTVPTARPTVTAAPVAAAGNLNFLGGNNDSLPNYAMIVIFALVAIIILAVIAYLCYCCCCPPVVAAAAEKKKKKEEEEDPNVLVIDVHNNDVPDDMLKAKHVDRPGPVSIFGPALTSDLNIDDVSSESSSSISSSETDN